MCECIKFGLKVPVVRPIESLTKQHRGHFIGHPVCKCYAFAFGTRFILYVLTAIHDTYATMHVYPCAILVYTDVSKNFEFFSA